MTTKLEFAEKLRVLLNVSNLFSQIDDKLGKLLHVDDVLGILRVGVDDLGASSDLKHGKRI